MSMKADRDGLISHLQMVGCKGRITEAVFDGSFSTAAITSDHQLLVVVPPFKLTHETRLDVDSFGISDLTRLAAALHVAAAGDDDSSDVVLEYRDHRLVIEEIGASLYLTCAHPSTIKTGIEDVALKAVLKRSESLTSKTPVDPELVDRILATAKLLSKSGGTGVDAITITLSFGESGGFIRVGREHEDQATFAAPALVVESGTNELMFGPHLLDVLSMTAGEEGCMIRTNPKPEPNRPQQLVIETAAGFHYFLSPRARGADA